jgi:predicted branched-subunit amino acid permease
MKLQPKGVFGRGLADGIPIALGYLSVSFGFGISAVSGGLSPFTAGLISLPNLTSAGQVAGLGIILAEGAFLEMAITQLVINIRYFLMSMHTSFTLHIFFKLQISITSFLLFPESQHRYVSAMVQK